MIVFFCCKKGGIIYLKKKEIDGIMENKTLLNILSPIGGIEYKKN